MEPVSGNVIQNGMVRKVLETVPSQFRKFSPEDLRGFLMTGHLELQNAGGVLMEEGSSELRNAWLIADGLLSVWKDNVRVASLAAGDFTGEEFLFKNGVRTATVKADTNAVLVRFEKSAVIEFFRTRPERVFKLFIMNLLEVQQRRIHALNGKVASLKRELEEAKGDVNT